MRLIINITYNNSKTHMHIWHKGVTVTKALKKRRILRAVSLLTVSGLACGVAQAGEEPAMRGESPLIILNPLTVSATRMETPLAKVPATVSVITARQIEENLVTSVKDLIRFEPGISVRSQPALFTAAGASTGRDGNSSFNIRGLEGNRVLIISDGIRVPDSFSFGPQAVGRGDYVDLSLLKSVEILRGPASALYGSDGVAGAVSFTTKDPDDILKPGEIWSVQASTSFSSANKGWARGAVVSGQSESGKWQGLAAYTRRDAGQMDNKGTNNSANTDRTRPNPQNIYSNAFLAKLLFLPAEGHRLRVIYDHEDRDIQSNVLSAIAKASLTATSTRGLLAHDNSNRDRVSFDHRFEGGQGFIAAGNWASYFQDSHTRQYSSEDRNTAADRIRDNTFDNRILGFNGQAHTLFETGMVSHHLTYGADYFMNRQSGMRTGTVPPAGESFPTRAFPTTDFSLLGIFLQDTISAFDEKLILYPALRFDTYELEPRGDALLTTLVPAPQKDSYLSAKFGGVFQATDMIGVYANYAMGFKAPSPSQVNNAFANLAGNYRSLPNPNLKPETSNTFEGGVRLSGEGWRVAAAGFSGEYENFIDQIQVGGNFTPTNPGLFQYINLSQVKISGAELKGEAYFESGFGGILAFSYAKGDSRTNGVSVPLNSIDPIKIVGGLSYRDPNGRFGAQLIGTYAMDKDVSRINAVCTPSCFATPSFFIMDATAFWNINETFSLRAAVFNIFDEKYWWWSDVRGLSSAAVNRDAYTQPGRNFSLSVTARF